MKTRWALLAAGAVLATVTGCGAAPASLGNEGAQGAPDSVSTDVDTTPATLPPASNLPSLAVPPTVTSSSGVAVPAVGIPTRLRIPAIHVDAPVKTTTERAGALLIPHDIQSTGWDDQTAQVGEPGSTLIVGHRDSTTADGALRHLEDLQHGDVLSVVVKGGGQRVYRVTSVRTYAKDDLPAAVFSTTGEHRLTAVTCGGRLVKSKADGLLHWSSNVVVEAAESATR